jgi:uncharacterized protein (DUF58 family)
VRRFSDIDKEISAAYCWVLLAGLGWWIRSVPLALVGMLGVVAAVALFVWQRECLVGVSYRRRLTQSRASFNEALTLEIEVVNDKLLPLSWLRIEDEIPALLEIEGATVISSQSYVDTMVHVMPILPYQRIRTRIGVIASHRGEFIFGPARISSGDPIGLRSRSAMASGVEHLLVYPKVFALVPAGLASRALIGEMRASFELLHDPSRVAGVREYRVGDPLRFVNWRATARRTSLLVREFEPSVTPRVAVFVDFCDPLLSLGSLSAAELEFMVAVAASIVTTLAGRKVAVGLFSPGGVSGDALAVPPSSLPTTLATILEGLARAVPSTRRRLSEVITAESSSLQRGTSAVVIAVDFAESTLAAIGELRRRHAVTAVWIETSHGHAPPPGSVDALVVARYSDDWPESEVLELDG